MSQLEEKIMKILKKERIDFEKEKTFGDLRQGRYRFDFYIPNLDGEAVLLEIQGEQHYQFVGKFYKSRQDFKAAQERDRRKISYCLGRGIKLYCIPYWKVDSIQSKRDLFSEAYIARTRWKNDEDWRQYQFSRNIP